MSITQRIAKQFRDVYFGENWTWANFKDTLADVSWEQAVKQVHSFNTIATLVYHTHYYVAALIQVLKGNPLEAKDKYSFDHPPIASEEDWQNMMKTVFSDAEKLTELIRALPDEKLGEIFVEEKYGTYYRNLHGMIEHCHYHLGQITLIKKLIAEENRTN